MFGMEIVVYEFGLREPVEKHKYFSIGNVLYAGNAVIFAVGAEGETVDITDAQLHTILSHTTFHHNAAAVEWNIQQGWIDRPQMLVNDELLWQWPQGNDAFKGRDSL